MAANRWMPGKEKKSKEIDDKHKPRKAGKKARLAMAFASAKKH